jgi:hypothetical protein
MTRYVALLRGINVGGKNLIKMTALRACFEELGFRPGHLHPERERALQRGGLKADQPTGRIELAGVNRATPSLGRASE